MNSIDVLSIIDGEVKKVKSQDKKVMEIAEFEKFIRMLCQVVEKDGKLAAEIFNANHDERMQGWRQKNEFKLSGWEARRQHHKTMFDAVIISGQGALKTCFLMNGGASVSILAFIGHLATSQMAQARITFFAVPLGLFVGGIFCSGLASALTYFSQRYYAKRKFNKGNAFRRAVLISGIASGAFFIGGAAAAYKSFITW